MNHMVDNLVGPEPSNGIIPPQSTPPAPSLASARGNGVNETSYVIGSSTLTALNFVNQVRSWSPKVPSQEVPNPPLPSILNSPFAPRPEEESVLSRSPGTKQVTPTQLSVQLPKHSLDSTASSMSEPTQLSFINNGHPLLYASLNRKPLGNRQHHGTSKENYTFDSSSVLIDSSFPYNARAQATESTPPNGQG